MQIDALSEVLQAVRGSGVEVYVDGGIRTGTDVFKALALGATAVFLGRPIIWGLACDVSNTRDPRSGTKMCHLRILNVYIVVYFDFQTISNDHYIYVEVVLVNMETHLGPDWTTQTKHVACYIWVMDRIDLLIKLGTRHNTFNDIGHSWYKGIVGGVHSCEVSLTM